MDKNTHKVIGSKLHEKEIELIREEEEGNWKISNFYWSVAASSSIKTFAKTKHLSYLMNLKLHINLASSKSR
jgi:Iap family predicted aminopeptidase